MPVQKAWKRQKAWRRQKKCATGQKCRKKPHTNPLRRGSKTGRALLQPGGGCATIQKALQYNKREIPCTKRAGRRFPDRRLAIGSGKAPRAPRGRASAGHRQKGRQTAEESHPVWHETQMPPGRYGSAMPLSQGSGAACRRGTLYGDPGNAVCTLCVGGE